QLADPRRAARSAIRRVPRSRILPVLCQQRAADLRPGSAAMKMLSRNLALPLAAILLAATPALAASEADYKAADAGDFDKAVAEAKEAEALAKASVFQAKAEKEAWKAEVIR